MAAGGAGRDGSSSSRALGGGTCPRKRTTAEPGGDGRHDHQYHTGDESVAQEEESWQPHPAQPPAECPETQQKGVLRRKRRRRRSCGRKRGSGA